MTAPPGPATPYGVYRAGVRRPLGRHAHRRAPRTAPRDVVADPTGLGAASRRPAHGRRAVAVPRARRRRSPAGCRSGTFVHARSGDKGGDANLGLWVAHDDSAKYADRVTWLTKLIDPK